MIPGEVVEIVVFVLGRNEDVDEGGFDGICIVVGSPEVDSVAEAPPQKIVIHDDPQTEASLIRWRCRRVECYLVLCTEFVGTGTGVLIAEASRRTEARSECVGAHG